MTTGFSVDIADHDQIPPAMLKVEQAMTPATVEQCETWLVMLQAATAHRADTEMSAAAAYTLYAGELRRWPADVAKAACERLARGKPGFTRTNWFPTLAELVAECERFAGPRRALLSSLQRWAPPEALPSRARDERERAAIRRMADETMAALKATAAAQRKPAREMPSIAGKPDETGITPQMRELLAKQSNR